MPRPTPGTAPDPRSPGPGEFSISAGADPARILAALQRISGCVARPAELVRLLSTLAGEAGALLHASAATATREPGGILALRVGSGILAPFEGDLLPVEGSFCGAALRSGEIEGSIDLSRDARAYPGEQELGAGPALAIALPAPDGASGVLLVVRPTGAAPFQPADRAALGALAEFAGAALSGALAFAEARARRAPIESWRRARDASAWLRSYNAVFAERGRTLLRIELESGRIEWGGASPGSPEAGEDTVEAWSQRVGAGDRERLVRALTSKGGVSRLDLSMTAADGQTRRFRLDTFPDAAEPGVLTALLTPTELGNGAASSRISELIRAVRHELNNPLAVVAGTVHLIESSGAAANTPELARSVQQIRDASDRLRDLSTRIGFLERKPEAAFVTEGGGLGVAS